MTRVGIRELRTHLSEYLRRVKQGEQLEITERGVRIAIIMPYSSNSSVQAMQKLVAKGIVTWSGGKPRVPSERISLPGKPLSQYVLEGRD